MTLVAIQYPIYCGKSYCADKTTLYKILDVNTKIIEIISDRDLRISEKYFPFFCATKY